MNNSGTQTPGNLIPIYKKGKYTMLKYLGTAALAALVLATGCKDPKSAADTKLEKITNVETYTVSPSTFKEFISLPVVVSPFKEANLGLITGGKITRIYTDKGERVTQGKVLLETDNVLLKAALDAAKANLEYQKNEFDRNTRLFKEGSITQAVFDASSLQLSNTQSAFDIAKKQFDNSILIAPFDGVITAKNIEVGDIIGPGVPAFRMIDVSRVKVQAGIPEKYITDFKLGNQVAIRFDAMPGKEFNGNISYIAPEASSSIRTFLAEMIVDNRQGLIKAGIMGNADILKKAYGNALSIPLNAVVQTQKGRIVYVVKTDSTVEERDIEIGPVGDLFIKIDKGLTKGDRVVVKGQQQIAAGEKVKIVSDDSTQGGEVMGK
jgi:RND family efflux transporter MFP subunit